MQLNGIRRGQVGCAGARSRVLGLLQEPWFDCVKGELQEP